MLNDDEEKKKSESQEGESGEKDGNLGGDGEKSQEPEKDKTKSAAKRVADVGVEMLKEVGIKLLKIAIFITTALIIFFMVLVIMESSKHTQYQNICYSNAEVGFSVEYILNVADIEARGKNTKMNDFTKSTQTPIWKETGLEATGDMIELWVSGQWYPVGQDNTAVAYKQASTDKNPVENGYEKCTMSDDLFVENYTCKYGYDKETGNCRYPQSKEEEMYPIKRYESLVSVDGVLPIYLQNSYITNYHLGDSSPFLTQQTPNGIKEKLLIDRDFSCALAYGYGSYIKFGSESKIAYHAANRGVIQQTKNKDGSYTGAYKTSGVRLVSRMPLIIPTVLYSAPATGKSPELSQNNPQFGSVKKIDISSDTWSKVDFFGNCASKDPSRINASTTQTINANTCEFEYPPIGEDIYVTVSASDYDYADGRLVFHFTSGARIKDSSKTEVLKTVWGNLVEKLFGIDVYNEKISPNGIIVRMRNAILKSIQFQSVAYMLLTMSFLWTGYQFIIGAAAVNTRVIINRTIHVTFGIYFINPDNYTVFDEWFVPTLLKFSNSVMTSITNGLINSTGLSGSNLNSTNPFVSYDQYLSTLIGDVTIAKCLALFLDGKLGVFMAPIILGIAIVIWIYVFKVLSGYLLSFMGLSIYLILFPIGAMFLLFHEKHKDKFDKIFNSLLKDSITSGAYVLSIGLFIGFINQYYIKLLSFSTCYTKIFDAYIFKIYGWKSDDIDQNTLFQNLIIMIIIMYFSEKIRKLFSSAISAIFGTYAGAADGDKIFNSSFDMIASNVTSAVNQGVGLANYGLNKVSGGKIGKDFIPRMPTVSSNDLNSMSSIGSKMFDTAKTGVNFGSKIFTKPVVGLLGSGAKRAGTALGKRIFGGSSKSKPDPKNSTNNLSAQKPQAKQSDAQARKNGENSYNDIEKQINGDDLEMNADQDRAGLENAGLDNNKDEESQNSENNNLDSDNKGGVNSGINNALNSQLDNQQSNGIEGYSNNQQQFANDPVLSELISSIDKIGDMESQNANLIENFRGLISDYKDFDLTDTSRVFDEIQKIIDSDFKKYDGDGSLRGLNFDQIEGGMNDGNAGLDAKIDPFAVDDKKDKEDNKGVIGTNENNTIGQAEEGGIGQTKEAGIGNAEESGIGTGTKQTDDRDSGLGMLEKELNKMKAEKAKLETKKMQLDKEKIDKDSLLDGKAEAFKKDLEAFYKDNIELCKSMKSMEGEALQLAKQEIEKKTSALNEKYKLKGGNEYLLKGSQDVAKYAENAAITLHLSNMQLENKQMKLGVKIAYCDKQIERLQKSLKQ